MNKFSGAMLDTDICIRFSAMPNEDYLVKLLDILCDQAYIHTYNLQQEFLVNRTQMDKLLTSGKVIEAKPCLLLSDINLKLYEATVQRLYELHTGDEIRYAATAVSNFRKRHLGECVSLALAQHLHLPCFATGDYEAKKTHLQATAESIVPTDFQVVHLDEIVEFLREQEHPDFTRRIVKKIYLHTEETNTTTQHNAAKARQKLAKARERFERLWPPSQPKKDFK